MFNLSENLVQWMIPQCFVLIVLVTQNNCQSIGLLDTLNANGNYSDRFGYSVSISGDTIVVGATGDDSNATGVNGDQNNNRAPDSGAAYVFVRHGSRWTQQAYLKASNTGEGDYFGISVSISGDTIVVGALFESSNATGVNGDQNNDNSSQSGAAYVFVREGTAWTQQAYLKASNTGAVDLFGCSVSISGDTIVVGAYQEDSSATGVFGDQNKDDAPNSGAAYVFVREGTTWNQQAYLKASNTEEYDSFGYSVSISGDTIVVGAYQEDSSATGVFGDQNDNTATGSGAAYVFVRHGELWTPHAYLKASNTARDDTFGCSVSISGDTIVVGAAGEASNATGVNGDQNNDNSSQSGAAYVFIKFGELWIQQAYLKASNTEAGDHFGYSVSISGDTIVVGAYLEDSNATGVNGDQNKNDALESGAAYVFVRDGSTWNQQAYLKSGSAIADGYFGRAVAVDEFIVAGEYGANTTTVFGTVIPTTGTSSTSTSSTSDQSTSSTSSASTVTSTTVTTETTGTGTTESTAVNTNNTDSTESTMNSSSATTGSPIEEVKSIDDSTTVIIIAVAVSLVVLAIFVSTIIVLVLYRNKRRNNDHSAHNSNSVSLTLQSKSMLKNIKVQELLGSGNFGE
jgi:hypothetical protein